MLYELCVSHSVIDLWDFFALYRRFSLSRNTFWFFFLSMLLPQQFNWRESFLKKKFKDLVTKDSNLKLLRTVIFMVVVNCHISFYGGLWFLFQLFQPKTHVLFYTLKYFVIQNIGMLIILVLVVVGDDVVSYKFGEKSSRALSSNGFKDVTFRSYSGYVIEVPHLRISLQFLKNLHLHYMLSSNAC